MGLRRRRHLLFLTVISIIIVVGGVRFMGKRWLTVDLEISGYGIPAQRSTSVVGLYGKQTLPHSFTVGRVNPLTLNDAHLHTTVMPGLVLFGFESTEPVDCMVVLDDEPSCGFDRPVDTVLVNISGCYEFYDALEIGERCVLSFCFKADTETLSDVTMMAARDIWFAKHKDSSIEVNQAVDTARVFLSLNGVNAGKYMSHTVEQRVPNYYWQKQFRYDNLANLVYQSLPAPRDYIAVCFEQKYHPGHTYEVWVEHETYQVLGGDTTR